MKLNFYRQIIAFFYSRHFIYYYYRKFRNSILTTILYLIEIWFSVMYVDLPRIKMIPILFYTLFCFIINYLVMYATEIDTFSTNQILHNRYNHLKRIALYDNESNLLCNSNRYVFISEYQFGQTGNNVIEFAHTLWISKQLNATLVLPLWMHSILHPFDTTILKSQFCFTLDQQIPKVSETYEITSEESFFLFKLFKDKRYKTLLPTLNNKTIDDLSLHFLQLYACLWCCPDKRIKFATEKIINHYLHNNLNYTAVHKRKLDGGCSQILGDVTKPKDFSLNELPMYHTDWNMNLLQKHPLCEMNLNFVLEIMKHNNRTSNSNLFVAYDGNGDISEYQKHHAIFSSILTEKHPDIGLQVSLKYIDMLVSIHSSLFILNPRSTYSWQIFIIRVCLGLSSVPTMKNNDFFLQRKWEIKLAKRPIWVSWTSIEKAYHLINTYLS